MRSPKGANVLQRNRRGAKMSDLTVAGYLGMLCEDPYDGELIEGLREKLKGPDPANDGQDPLRLLEAARGGPPGPRRSPTTRRCWRSGLT